jgi:integrase
MLFSPGASKGIGCRGIRWLSWVASRCGPPPPITSRVREFDRLLAVTHDRSHWQKNPAHRVRVRALLLLMRHSGLRLNDAVTLERARLQERRIFLYQQKTGLPVYVPLPKDVAELLDSLPNSDPRYFFWTGNGLRYRGSNCWHASSGSYLAGS